MKTAVHIGHTVTGRGEKKRAKMILKILNSQADQKTIRAALAVFSRVTKMPRIDGVHLEGVTINMPNPDEPVGDGVADDTDYFNNG